MFAQLARRTGVAALAGSVAAAALVSTSSTPARADAVAESATLSWLTSQLGADNLVNGDVGTTIDFGLALNEVGGPQATIDRIKTAVDTNIAGYASWAVPQAHAAVFYEVVGAGSTATAVDLVDKVEAATDDTTGFFNAGAYSGAWSQWLAVRALTLAESPEAPKATDYLVGSQCPDGGWGDSRCATDPDNTADALFALLPVAGSSEAVDTAIEKGVAWLLGHQKPTGAWEAWGEESGNSTGLAAQALAMAGEKTAAVTSAARWLRARQVAGTPCDGRLISEGGAVAASDTVLAEGKTSGLVDPYGYDWYRSSIQALPTLVMAPAGGALGLTGPQFVKASSSASVTAIGLAPGANGCISFAGKNVAIQGGGTTSAAAALPAGTRAYPATVRTVGGSATSTVVALAPKKLKVRLGKSSVRRGARQSVKVAGLYRGESVRITYGGRVVAKGKANANGVFRGRFKVRRSTGVKKVAVRGQFATRKNTVRFRVVR